MHILLCLEEAQLIPFLPVKKHFTFSFVHLFIHFNTEYSFNIQYIHFNIQYWSVNVSIWKSLLWTGYNICLAPSLTTEYEWLKSLSRVRLFVTPWTVAHQAPLSMEFSRQEYWSELPFPSPGDLPDPGIKPMSPALQADALPSEPPWKPPL